MASVTTRRNGDGSTSWDALVRVVGYPATGKSFRTSAPPNYGPRKPKRARKAARSHTRAA